MLILIPFIFILLFLVPEKELSDVFNLTKMADRKLKMVHNVVFDGRIDLLDSANVQLQLVIVPDTTGNGCSVNYPSEVFKVVQIGNTLRIRVSDEGKSLLRKNLRLLQNADMNKIDPDTIYSSDTLKIKLLADRGLENINLKYEHEIVRNFPNLPFVHRALSPLVRARKSADSVSLGILRCISTILKRAISSIGLYRVTKTKVAPCTAKITV